jgi:hypothetical protein
MQTTFSTKNHERLDRLATKLPNPMVQTQGRLWPDQRDTTR